MIILLLMFLSAASPGDVHARPSARHSTPLGDLVVLSLATDRANYYVREPVRLRLTLKNVHRENVSGLFMISPLSPKAEIHYRRADSSFAVFPFPGRRSGYGEAPVTLGPDEEISGEATLAFDAARQEPLFSEPGNYEFQVAYRDRPNDASTFLESNVVIVQVMPVPSDQAEALAAYSSDLALLAQFNPRWSYLAPAVAQKAAEFLDRFPNSPYAYYVRRGLHRALRDRVVGNRATREEQELYERLQVENAANP